MVVDLNKIPVPDDQLDRLLLEFNFKRYLPYIHGIILDVGCGSGGMTELIYNHFLFVEGVDGSSERIQEAQLRLPNLKFHNSYFENFKPKYKFNTCISSSVLEHLSDKKGGLSPTDLLRLCYKWLYPKGTMIVGVPNLNSLHKHVGRAMGFNEQLTEKDKSIGHVSVFTLDSLENIMTKAGFNVIKSGGVTIKPLPNDDLRKLTNWYELMCGYFKISESPILQPLCSVIYVIGEKD